MFRWLLLHARAWKKHDNISTNWLICFFFDDSRPFLIIYTCGLIHGLREDGASSLFTWFKLDNKLVNPLNCQLVIKILWHMALCLIFAFLRNLVKLLALCWLPIVETWSIPFWSFVNFKIQIILCTWAWGDISGN